MPHNSSRKELLGALKDTHRDLVLARYVMLLQGILDELFESNSDDNTGSESDGVISDSSMHSLSSHTLDLSWSSVFSGITASSLLSSHRHSSEEPAMYQRIFGQFIDAVCVLHDEVEKSCVLNSRPKLSCSPQLHLLPEWVLHAPEKFQ